MSSSSFHPSTSSARTQAFMSRSAATHQPFPDPPTKETLASARRLLENKRVCIHSISAEIARAEQALAELLRDARHRINEMEVERARMVDEEQHTLAYLSPLRRLPQELVREIFMWCFEEHACAAWILSAVCSSWRAQALRMPLLWSKIRLVTTPAASADIIRLWLERSGDIVPLDIEIFLRVAPPNTQNQDRPSSRRTGTSLPSPTGVTVTHWATSSTFPPPHGLAQAAYIAPSLPPPPVPILTPSAAGGASTAGVIAGGGPGASASAEGGEGASNLLISPDHSPHDPWNVQLTVDRPGAAASKISMHWGHIAFFYLGEHMHRWQRFIFRFDRQFTSMGALKSLNGDAPMLREFEVSSAEAGYYVEWPWLPNSDEGSNVCLPKLRSVTLQHTPFKWSSPMLKNLEHLTLRATPTSHLPLDRIQGILSASPGLKTLAIHFQGVLPLILPMSPLTLPDLTDFSIGGHYLLTQLIDTLILPSLKSLTIDVEARDPIEDTLSNLVARSCSPPLSHLSIAYGSASNAGPAFYYGPSGTVASWGFLADAGMNQIKTLKVGGTPLEHLLAALGPPDDDTNPVTSWACPTLESISMKNCHSHSDGVANLVALVEARNPPLGGGGGSQSVGGVSPGRIKRLELLECPSLGGDVVRWLESRIDRVRCTEPTERSPIVHHPYI
ncbi:hypothetical protein BKA70DRAFT_1426627 [Coprinopsis sp. MPI-PUGE-AT-0042]|nr:hypothetical protein BKA70DRAFT_1426627 [Coprinopsis sp. MPI-PUGE-AT-0042]